MRTTTICIAATLSSLVFVAFSPSARGNDTNVSPYPLEYFALRDVISNVLVSPDGRYLALLAIPSRDGDAVIEVYETADLVSDKKPVPFRVDAKPMEILGIDWVSDTNLVVELRQKVRNRIDGFNRGVYETRIAKLDVRRQEIEAFDEINISVDGLLPNKPNKIIVALNDGRRFGPRSYYEFDLKKGTKKLLVRGNPAFRQVTFDSVGNPWTARGFDTSEGAFVWYHRAAGSKSWEEIYRLGEDSFEVFNINGFDDKNRDILFVTATNGNDKIGLWEFDVTHKQFRELTYRRNDVDVAGVRYHSNPWTHPDRVTGVAVLKDKLHVEYFDGLEQATYRQLESLLENAHDVRITSRSRDGQTLTVSNVGPRDPGTYYLLKSGRFIKIGSRQPLLASERLADVEYLTYQSRDNRIIPAFITIPHGEPPYAAVVMPHGGPFVRETVAYNEWGQMLANNGYLVLQPQYRGSRGYGIDFYTSAFVDGGQGGRKMQDDKDDGVLYLIERGLVDRDRVAMFGWSYGGYAALVAASRQPQLYQCVMAGAAVTDTIHQVNYYRDRLRGAERVEQLRMWTDSLSPLQEVNKINVPILLIHGSVDQRVPVVHASKYLRALAQSDKRYRYLELEGADHFSNTLFYRHQIELYETLIGYLKNECGPGGL